MTKGSLTQDLLKEALHYDPDTGVFAWKVRPRDQFKSGRSHKYINNKFAGIEAGTINANGYRSIAFLGKIYKAHRMAWLYMTGEWPKNEVDHINHAKLDNRWKNLRDVTSQDNQKNMNLKTTNTSGVLGVSWAKRQKSWIVGIGVDNKKIHIGYFKDFRKAIEARENANIKYGFHKNHGMKNRECNVN